MGPFRERSTGPGTCSLDFPLSMAAVYPWFHTSLLNPAGPQPIRPPALVDTSYKLEAILQINKCIIHAKVKWVVCDSFYNQWIQLSQLRGTACEVVKTF